MAAVDGTSVSETLSGAGQIPDPPAAPVGVLVQSPSFSRRQRLAHKSSLRLAAAAGSFAAVLGHFLCSLQAADSAL